MYNRLAYNFFLRFILESFLEFMICSSLNFEYVSDWKYKTLRLTLSYHYQVRSLTLFLVSELWRYDKVRVIWTSPLCTLVCRHVPNPFIRFAFFAQVFTFAFNTKSDQTIWLALRYLQPQEKWGHIQRIHVFAQTISPGPCPSFLKQ